MSIDLGNIRFNGDRVTFKTHRLPVGTPRELNMSINEFSVGDYVGIDHHPEFVERNASFKIIKVNRVRGNS